MKPKFISILIASAFIGCSGNFKNSETFCKCLGEKNNFTKADIIQCKKFWEWIEKSSYETLEEELKPIQYEAMRTCPETYKKHLPYQHDFDLSKYK